MTKMLSSTQQAVLLALLNGSTLKSHRYLDGRKVYKLHPLEGSAQTVRRPTVACLHRYGLIESNMKFPAATYLLTPEGQALAVQFGDVKHYPLSATSSK